MTPPLMRLPNCSPAALAGLAVVLLSATAQASSLIVDGAFQESSNVTSRTPPAAGACNNTNSFCYIIFTKIPAGKQLAVTQVSCQLGVSAGEVTQLYLLPQRPNGNFVERFQFLTSSERPSTTPGTNIVVNNTAYQLFNENERPEIYIQLTANAAIDGFCSITGQLTNKPA